MCDSGGDDPTSKAGQANDDEPYTGELAAAIWALGGTGMSEGINHLMSVERLDVKACGDALTLASKWEPTVQMRTPRLGACGVWADGALYVVGGWNGSSHDCSMEKCVDGAELEWQSAAEMRAPRTFSGMAALGSVLYVCGGMTMQKAGVVAHGSDKIVVIGGVDGDGTALKSVEWLDTKTGTWHKLADLPEARAAPGAVIYEDDIYVFGGCGVDGVPLASGHKLADPFSSLANSAWEKMPEMRFPRGGFGMVCAKHLIVAIGGSSVNSQHLKETEYLNLKDLTTGTATWQPGPQMASERRYPATAVLHCTPLAE